MLLEVGGLKKQQVLWALYAGTAVLILFIGLRYNTGSDWKMYITAFKEMPTLGNYHHWEYGFFLISNIFHFIFGNYYVLQFATTCFICLSACKLFKQHSEFPVLLMPIFFFLFFDGILMAQVRQSIALGIIALGSKYIFNHKFIPFLCVIAAACLFHISAIMAIPLYFLNKNFGRIVPVIVILIAQIFYFFPEIIFSFIRFVAPYLPERLSKLAEGYLTTAFAEKAVFGTGIYYLATVLLVVLLLLFVKPKNDKETFFMNTLMIAFVIKGLSTGVFIMERFQAYYLLFGMMAYPCLLSVRLKRIKGTAVAFALCLCVFFSVPFFKLLTSTKISNLTGRPTNYSYVPYYNALYHPLEATKRKDWEEKNEP
jgi:hypothetical protein